VSGFVLDCSIAVAWCFEDEAEPAVDALLDDLKVNGVVVPALWPLEVINVLVQAERRGRITMAAVDGRLAAFAALPITVDAASSSQTGPAVLALARLHGLTAYDAAYLELATRRQLPLATRDKALQQACAAVGIVVLPDGQQGGTSLVDHRVR
jgi:predicted nucleic acid-binding protein